MARILYVDDEPDIRNVIVEELEECGHTVAQANNGSLGVEVAIEFKPEIVLCDCLMPVMTGPEMIRTLRENRPEFSATPFVMISAYADQAHLDEAKAAGAAAYLTKPMDFDELESLVDRLIDEAGQAP